MCSNRANAPFLSCPAAIADIMLRSVGRCFWDGRLIILEGPRRLWLKGWRRVWRLRGPAIAQKISPKRWPHRWNVRGIERGARCGYPVGLSYPPDWGERTISLRDEDNTILEAGMTFHFMPGLWMDDWGLAITETILIDEKGPAECLCKRPRKIFVKP